MRFVSEGFFGVADVEYLPRVVGSGVEDVVAMPIWGADAQIHELHEITMAEP